MKNNNFENIDVNFYGTAFNEIAYFHNCKFNKVYFSDTQFNGRAIFRDSVFKGVLDLRKTIFDIEANFLDITSKERKKENDIFLDQATPVKVANRETARILKHNFEKSGNRIESNIYHALELEQKRNRARSK